MTSFPPKVPDKDDINVINNKKWVFDGHKWELLPLTDNVSGILPVVVEEDSIAGEGRDLEHSFTIKKLNDLETRS